jgi:general secretion pathway protein J
MTTLRLHTPLPRSTPRNASHLPRQQRGFTLIELLIALGLMAVLAGLSWRGLDQLMRTKQVTQAQVDQTAVLQTVLAQWQADLNAVRPVPQLSDAGVAWDGKVLRLTRRATAWQPDGRDAGLWVVAWTLRDQQWRRWQSPPLQSRAAVQQAWAQAQRWGQNPGSDDLPLETPLVPADAWQLLYYRSNAWTNPLSADGSSPTSGNSATALPDAIRLLIDLPASTGAPGRITLDWVRPNFSNTKS